MNEITKTQQIGVVQGEVRFPEYEKMKQEAMQIAEFVKNIVVTEDTVKDAKKVLANSNKIVKQLNDERIAIKKELLEPYNIFEAQIKEIEAIITEANDGVRIAVRELEEMERSEKEDKITELWNERMEAYPYRDRVKLTQWLRQQHLNKTVTMKQITQEMTDWLATVQTDLDYLTSLHNPDLLVEYPNTFNVAMTLRTIDERQKEADRWTEQLKRIEEEKVRVVEEEEEQEDKEDVAVFMITGAKDIALAELLLQQNNINYIKGDH